MARTEANVEVLTVTDCYTPDSFVRFVSALSALLEDVCDAPPVLLSVTDAVAPSQLLSAAFAATLSRCLVR